MSMHAVRDKSSDAVVDWRMILRRKLHGEAR